VYHIEEGEEASLTPPSPPPPPSSARTEGTSTTTHSTERPHPYRRRGGRNSLGRGGGAPTGRGGESQQEGVGSTIGKQWRSPRPTTK